MEKIIDIDIWRDEEKIPVSCEIVKYYKGTNEYDDPTVVEVNEMAYDSNGRGHRLTIPEMEQAESDFLSQIS